MIDLQAIPSQYPHQYGEIIVIIGVYYKPVWDAIYIYRGTIWESNPDNFGIYILLWNYSGLETGFLIGV